MPPQSLKKAFANSVWDALREGELERSEHLCRAILRLEREHVEKILLTGREQLGNNPCHIRDGGYLPKDYLITAIISTYKAERFMEGRLLDLLGQSISDRIEILVIDSASPEHEGEIVGAFQRSHTNIRYLRTGRRESIYQAWNRGVTTARGRYLTNANTDDRLRYDTLERLVAMLEQEDGSGVAYADAFITTGENESFHDNSSLQSTRRPPFSLNALLESCVTGSQPVWRRELHKTVGLFDIGYSSAADYDFFIRAAQVCKFSYIPEPAGLVWTSPETFSSKGVLPLLEFYDVRERYRHLLTPTGRNTAILPNYENIWENVQQNFLRLRNEAIGELVGESPMLNYQVGLLYEQTGDNGNAWRYLQRAAYLVPEQSDYREALKRSLTTNLIDTIRTKTQEEFDQASIDQLQTTAIAARMLGCPHTAAWLYAQALERDRENAVSLVNLERTLASVAVSEGEPR
jgi:glycosyltransferase involved in cell wall biosynthesis